MTISKNLNTPQTEAVFRFSREISIFITVTPEVVYRYISDIRRHAEWATEPLDIMPEPGLARRFRSVAQLGPMKIKALVEVLSEEPPSRLVYQCKDLFWLHRWTVTLDAEGSGTRLIQRVERIEGPWWVRLLQPMVLWPAVGKSDVQNGLHNLKNRLEKGVLPAGRNEVK